MKKNLEIIHSSAAGIDIGSRGFFVSVGEGEVREFSTFTEGCIEVRDYLLLHNISTVAMESTGVYWVNLYSVLENAGIDVFLVNGRDVKNLPGRKSDVKDCQWLCKLHTYGLLRKSFIPGNEIRIVRNLLRLRQDHIRAAASQVHLMQKALTQMNIRLTEVLSDITGTSGLQIIEAILAGERDPKILLNLCVTRLKEQKGDLILKALEGQYHKEQLFALRHALQIWHYYNSLIEDCDHEIHAQLEIMTKDKKKVEPENPRKPIRYNKPRIPDLEKHLLTLSEGKDPINIAGITDYSFLQIMSEVGTDMSPWPTEKHFTSWLKVAPMKASSGKMQKRITMKRHNNAGQLFRTIAQGIMNSKYLALGAFGRRIRARRGSSIAIKAVARKIATYYYRVMTKGTAFVERGIENYEQHLKDKQLKGLKKLATKLNYQLVPN